MGEKVIYVEKWPWSMKPNYPWWEYRRRPQVNKKEMDFLQENLSWSTAISIFAIKPSINVFKGSSSYGGASLQGVSHGHKNVAEIDIEDGRYFTEQESSVGRNVVIIGANIAKELFPRQRAVGEKIMMRRKKYRIIGVMKKQGENLLGAPSNDEQCIIPYKTLAKSFRVGKRGIAPRIAVKGYESDKGLEDLENEIREVMRRRRGLRPSSDDNFALNRPEFIAQVLDGIIIVLTLVGWVIGGFSILIGGFGIANIMFVSVKERTNIIGIQKALGAKNYFILFQFLFEAMALSIVGGALGITLVSFLSSFSTESFVIELNMSNVTVGLMISGVIGVLAGIIPAISASRMDPVKAIRSK